MVPGLIPHRYARALYKFAAENGRSKEVYDEMLKVVNAFRSDKRFEKILSNPFVDEEDKRKLLLSAAGEKPGEDYRRFVSLILEHHREEFAYLMALAYRDIYRKENNISEVKITTAVKLPDAEIDKIKKVVEKSFKDVTFEYDYEINPEIIGGFIIDVDSTRMDASIGNELEQLRQNLTTN